VNRREAILLSVVLLLVTAAASILMFGSAEPNSAEFHRLVGGMGGALQPDHSTAPNAESRF
jgi:hypothetical protein